jgi:hypothetical protein
MAMARGNPGGVKPSAAATALSSLRRDLPPPRPVTLSLFEEKRERQDLGYPRGWGRGD